LSLVQDTRQDRIAQEDPLLIAADLSRGAVAIPPAHQEAALPDHLDPPVEVHPEAEGKEAIIKDDNISSFFLQSVECY
jgi:hypothetical protein